MGKFETFRNAPVKEKIQMAQNLGRAIDVVTVVGTAVAFPALHAVAVMGMIGSEVFWEGLVKPGWQTAKDSFAGAKNNMTTSSQGSATSSA